jgi:hypothetical protein
MTHTARTPTWLRIAAAVIVAQDVVALLVSSITGVGVAWVAVGVLLAWFLLRGSRVAWVFAVFSAAAQLSAPLTLNGPVWLAVTAMIVLACLLAPSSRSFVWADGQRPASGPWRSAAQRIYRRFLALAYNLAVRVPLLGGGPANEKEGVPRPSRGKLILTLALSVVVLYPLVGALSNFHDGSARGSIIVDVLWRVVWIGFTFLRLALIILLVAAASHYASKVTQGRKSSTARSKT